MNVEVQWRFALSILIHEYRAARILLGRMTRFIRQHPFLCSPAAASLLTADFFDGGALGSDVALLHPFNLVQQQSSSEETVQSLLTRALALDLQAGGAMEQHDAGGGLVDILS